MPAKFAANSTPDEMGIQPKLNSKIKFNGLNGLSLKNSEHLLGVLKLCFARGGNGTHHNENYCAIPCHSRENGGSENPVDWIILA